MQERELQHAIRLAVGAHPDKVVLWRNNVGVAVFERDGRTQRVEYGLAPGSADLVGLTREGRFVALELKTEKGRLSVKQQDWLDIVRRMGGIAAVVRSVDDALAVLGIGDVLPDSRKKALRAVKAMSPRQIVASSVKSGIHTADGRLTEHYKDAE